MKILITGTAGFIGFHLAKRLVQDGFQVVGLDNINDYYDVKLKLDRLKESGISEVKEDELVQSDIYPSYRFLKTDLKESETVRELFEKENFDVVVNLAAQAGVRYSLQNPYSYIESNISGFLNILEGCRHSESVKHLIYASSSSVYGANTEMPFHTEDRTDHPVSLYAASKKSNELMAYTYSHLYDLPTTGLRFFTVYGPWGRPDMALYIFTKAMAEGRTIDIYNHGNMERDFTYIDDIVEGIVRLVDKAPLPKQAEEVKSKNKNDSKPPCQLFNIGHGSPVKLMDFVQEIEKNLGVTASKNMMPIQPGDVPKTWADVENLFELTEFRPEVTVEEGVKRFVDWYEEYHATSKSS
jgi:UDP-glucuronate 4-epimerase